MIGKLVTRDDLNARMEFDCPIQVHADGSVSDGPDNVYAPSLMDRELDSPDWEFFSTGYTGQYGYRGPIMHNSEFIGGRLADDILAEPGIYCAVVADWSPEDGDEDGDTVEGWAVVRLTASACRHSWVAGMMGVHDEDLVSVAAMRSVECEKCETVIGPDTATDVVSAYAYGEA